jgi:hypothetical protein
VELLGPLFYSQQEESEHQWGVPPLGISYINDPANEHESFDFAYPLMTWRRFGREYRWQFFQVLNSAGGQVPGMGDTHRFTLYPIFFWQRSDDTNLNYTGFIPFYGHIQHRLFRDQIDFVLLPLYVKSRKQDVVTRNMPWPFFDLRAGNGLRGWQLWPLTGTEHKTVTTATNGFGDTRVVGGYDHFFALWPFYFASTDGIGTYNLSHDHALVPIFDCYRSPLRDSTSYLWPFGVTHTLDRENKYEEWDAPWPLVEFAHGEGKTTRRIWPFFSQARNSSVQDDWYLWPLWWSKHAVSSPLDYRRTRILLFLYMSVTEKNTDTGHAQRRDDFWPFYAHDRDFNGNERLQVLSIFEPFFSGSESAVRDYSPLWALWRFERNPSAGADSESLLWNLYRRDVTAHSKKISLLLGLFQYQSSPDGWRSRLFYIPMGGAGRKPMPAHPAAG